MAPSGSGGAGHAKWIALALVAMVLAIYGQTAHHPFVALDDDMYVVANPHVAGGPTPQALVWALTHAHAGNWHPLTWMSHMVDARLFGIDPHAAGAHHLVSVALHAANAVLLFVALRLLTGALWPSAWVAALFAVHPLRVESVAWVSERKDVLSGLCFVTALVAYARYARRRGRGAWWAVVAAQVAGLMAKPTLVTLPLILLLLDLWPLRRWRPFRPGAGARAESEAGAAGPGESLGALVREKALLFAACAAAAVATFLAQRAEGAVAPLAAISWGARLVNACSSLTAYLWKTAWPTALACFYPHPATVAPTPGAIAATVAGALLLVAITGAAWRARTRQPYLLAGWLWFLITLAPMLGLIQVGNQGWADRYAYLSLIGIYIGVAWGVRDWAAPRPAVRGALAFAAVATAAALAFAAHAQARVWRDSETLYRHAVAVTRDNWFAWNALGVLATHDGRLEEAQRDFERSLESLRPALRAGFHELHNNLGLLLLQEGRYDDARAHLEQALAARPDLPEAENNLALLELRQGRLEEAVAHAERAIHLRPGFADAHYNLALVREAQDRPAEAAANYRQVLGTQPEDPDAHARLGILLARLGREQEARTHLTEALRLSPGRADAESVLTALPAGRDGSRPERRP